MFSNKTYDIINVLAKYILPLLSTIILNFNNELGFADSEIISLIFIESIAFLNGLLGISSIWYYKDGGDKPEPVVKQTRVFTSFPSVDNLYFIRGDRDGTREGSGGYSPCTDGNKQLVKGGTLNNCVAAAWGLFAMAENNPKCKVGFIKSATYPQDAGTWYNNGQPSKWDTYERGVTPRLGSVLCYDHHVVFVNEILDNGNLLVWSSSYGSDNPAGFEEVLIKKDTGYAWRNSLAGNFQGFIYPRI